MGTEAFFFLISQETEGPPSIWVDSLGIFRFQVQGQTEARRELNKLNQLFGSGKISKAK